MAIDPRTSRFWQETLRSGLLDEAALRTCWEAIPEEKRDLEAIDRRMARQAISNQMLTLWQAQQVLAGRAMALKIGKYVALDIIGRGGMGLVFLARDTRLRRQVAIKVLSRDRMSSPRALARTTTSSASTTKGRPRTSATSSWSISKGGTSPRSSGTWDACRRPWPPRSPARSPSGWSTPGSRG
jgi:serine/threonine protein kinase